MQAETRSFVKLIKLVDLRYEEETQEQQERWLRNVKRSGVEEGYTLHDDGDAYITKQFTTDEIEFTTVECYNFMGSAYEDESFYAADWITVVERATGDVYAYETEEMFAF